MGNHVGTDENGKSERSRNARILVFYAGLIVLTAIAAIKFGSPPPELPEQRFRTQVETYMAEMAGISDSAEKAEAYRKIAAKYAGSGDATDTMLRDWAAEQAALAESQWQKERLKKASGAERTTIADEIIARFKDEDDVNYRQLVVEAYNAKIAAAGRDGKIRLYDEVIALFAGDSSDFGRSAAGWAMNSKARYLPEDKKLAVYDQVLELYSDDGKGAYTRAQAAYAKISKAKMIADRTEKARLLDEVVEKNRDFDDDGVQERVAWAMWERSLPLDGNDNKKDLLQGIVDKYGDGKYPSASRYYFSAFRRLVGSLKSAEARAAAYDKALGDGGDGMTPEWRADLLLGKADNVGDAAGKMRLYDEVIDVLSGASDPKLQLMALRAWRRKADLSPERDEKMRIYEEVEKRYGKSTDRYVVDEVDKFFSRRLALYNDAAEKRAAIEEVMASLGPDGNPKRLAKLHYAALMSVNDAKERNRLLDEFIEKYADGGNAGLGSREIAEAWLHKADMMEDGAEKAAMYDRIIERFKDDVTLADTVIEAGFGKVGQQESAEDRVAVYDMVLELYGTNPKTLGNYRLREMVQERAQLLGGDPWILDYFDTMLATAVNEKDRWNLLWEKARLLSTVDEKAAAYDELIALGSASDNPDTRRIVFHAYYWKGLLTADRMEKNRNLEQMLDFYKRSDFGDDRGVLGFIFNRMGPRLGDAEALNRFYDGMITAGKSEEDVVWAVEFKRQMTDDPVEKQALDERIVVEHRNSENKNVQRKVGDAMLRLAQASQDGAKKIALLDELIEYEFKSVDQLSVHLLSEAFAEKAKLAGSEDGKLAVYDEFLALAMGGDERRIGLAISAMRAKAELVADSQKAIRLYDELLAFLENEPGFRSTIDSASIAKARLESKLDDELAIYDAIIERNADDTWGSSELREALSKKAKALNDDSIIDRFYDPKIAGAIFPPEKARLLKNKAETYDDPKKKLAVYEELIAVFKDSRDVTVLEYVGAAMHYKAEALENSEEKLAAYDDLLAFYKLRAPMTYESLLGDITLAKAKLIDDPEEKIRLLDFVIERGWNSAHAFDFIYVEEAQKLKDEALLQK